MVGRGWRGRGLGEWRGTVDGYGASFWGGENVLELDSDDGCTTFGIY